MIRSELIGKLVETHPHLARPVVEAVLNAILNEIIDGLAQGRKVEIRGFGNFSSKVRKARMGRDPRNGEPVQVDPKRILHFKASKLLLEQMNQSTTPADPPPLSVRAQNTSYLQHRSQRLNIPPPTKAVLCKRIAVPPSITAARKTGAAMQRKPVTTCSDAPKLNHEAKRFTPPSKGVFLLLSS